MITNGIRCGNGSPLGRSYRIWMRGEQWHCLIHPWKSEGEEFLESTDELTLLVELNREGVARSSDCCSARLQPKDVDFLGYLGSNNIQWQNNNKIRTRMKPMVIWHLPFPVNTSLIKICPRVHSSTVRTRSAGLVLRLFSLFFRRNW